MCCICYVKNIKNFPKKETLLSLWNHNRDGGGIMWKTKNNELFFKKGYFDFETFYEDAVTISKEAKEMALHCRIATSGGINQEMCHPFMLTKSKGDFYKLEGESVKPLIMHNGIINIDVIKGLSDTCTYIKKKLYPRYKRNKGFMHDNNYVNSISNEIGGSKLVIFSKTMPTKLIGDWKEKDGCYYSNLLFDTFDYFKYYKTSYVTKYDIWDDFYDTFYLTN